MTELRQVLSLKQTLQLVMTPQLQQAIKLLQLSRLELNDLVHKEMLENPVLEESAEGEESNSAAERAEETKEKIADRIERIEQTGEVKGDGVADIDWEQYLEQYASAPPPVGPRVRPSEDLPSYENVLAKKASLSDHLSWQLRLSDLSGDEQAIGAQIIMSLNSDGYLVADDEDRLSGKTAVMSIAESMEGADVVIGLSRPGPGTIKPEWVERMNNDAIVFACANPVPEIWPWEAKAAGARVVATGRSDFPNQVNNSLGFPGIFRGALDVRASSINDEMKLAASYALANLAKEPVPQKVLDAYQIDHLEFGHEYVVPKPFDKRVCLWEAPAVAQAAIDSDVARVQSLDIEEYRQSLRKRLLKG